MQWLIPFIPWIGGLLALGCLLQAFKNFRRKSLSKALPTSRALAVFIGLVEMKGAAECQKPLRARLTDIQCIHHEWFIDEALKMIRSGELADAEQVKRFYAEAAAAAKLDHPGIVPVYEVGEANGQHFFSMALVVGASLNERVKADGPLPPQEAARLLTEVVEAVEYAHGKGRSRPGLTSTL